MSFGERNVTLGLALSVLLFTLYWAIILTRATGDSAPFTDVAWQGPLLLIIIIGGGVYAVVFAVARWRVRATRSTDERDIEILSRAESEGSVLTALAVLATLTMLALEVDTFWIAHVLFVGSFFGGIVSSAIALKGYRAGITR